MRKRRKRVVLAVAIAAVLFTGCTAKTGGNSAESDVSQEQKGEVMQTESTENKIELSFFGPIWKPYPESSPILDELMKRTNTKIDFEWVDNDSFETKLAAKVASKELPDIICVGQSTKINMNDLIRSGVLIPLTEYVETSMPNYSRFLTEEDRIQIVNQEDGEIYAIGMLMDVPPAYSTMIRKDWLDNLGLSMPQTWEEWVQVWRAFKTEDANGNGDANDEIPFAVNYEYFKFLMNIFGMQSNGRFSIVDGEYLYDPENPQYEAFLDEMRMLYAEGLFAKEFVTLVSTDFNTLGASNTLGSLIGFAEYAKNYTISCREIDEDALFQCVTPILGPRGAQNIPARAKVTLNTYITAEAAKQGKTESIIQLLDYIYSDEGIELTNYGIEGEFFERVDGKPILKAPYNESFTVARQSGLIPSTIPFYFSEEVYMQILTGGMSYEELDDAGKTFMDGMTINNDYYYTEPPMFMTEAYTDHFDLLEQQEALRDRYIMGQIEKEEYNSGYEKLKAAGLHEVIEQGKEAYRSVKEGK
ncbi:MAG: extracellular solute-binding protein [bacterium]|nr:extracellular solute-binding protein [bacterium]